MTIKPPPPPPPKPPLPPIRSNVTVLRPAAQNPNWFQMSPRIALDPAVIEGKTIGIFGTNGSGKSGTTRRLIEEHIAKGLDKYPFTVADIENEFATLKELGEIIIAGLPLDYGVIKTDVTVRNSGEFYELGRRAFQERLSVVLLLGDLEDESRKEYLQHYLDGIFQAANDPLKAHYYRVFVEEAQEYVPQVGGGTKTEDPLRASIIRFAKRGRKRGLSLVIISQRPANVDKNVISQAHLMFLHFVTYPTDLNLYESSTGFGIANAREKCGSMSPGDTIFTFGKVVIEDRITKPITVSPWDKDSSPVDVSKFKTVQDTTDLQESIIREGKDSDQGTSVVPTAYIHTLERKIPELEGQIAALVQTQINLENEIENFKSVVKKASTGDVAIDELIAENTRLKNEIGPLRADAMIVGLLRDALTRG